MCSRRTKEPQYQVCVDLADREGLARLGLMSNQVWHDDPRRLVFLLARYKFVAKMLSGAAAVLEVGCGDAFGSRIVRQEVEHLLAVDFDPVLIESALARRDPQWPIDCRVHDILQGPVAGSFQAAYSLDVIEHIPPQEEHTFLQNIAASLTSHGPLIIGTPSLSSQRYASPPSKEGHVNCKDAPGWKAALAEHFHNVFIFSMNDEVVHTGFYPMAHYLLAVCCGKTGTGPGGGRDGD